MEKFTKEYAEKLAREHSDHLEPGALRIISRLDFKEGYLKALEETNVKELYEALEKIKRLSAKEGIVTGHFYEIAEQALNKLNNQ